MEYWTKRVAGIWCCCVQKRVKIRLATWFQMDAWRSILRSNNSNGIICNRCRIPVCGVWACRVCGNLIFHLESIFMIRKVPEIRIGYSPMATPHGTVVIELTTCHWRRRKGKMTKKRFRDLCGEEKEMWASARRCKNQWFGWRVSKPTEQVLSCLSVCIRNQATLQVAARHRMICGVDGRACLVY